MADRQLPHVLVVSHRRSGTHLTIDAIRGNCPGYEPEFLNIDRLSRFHPERLPVDDARRALDRGSTVLKSHMLPDIERFFGDPDAEALVDELLRTARVVYVHRDGRDVLASLYFYAKNFDGRVRDLTFPGFLRMSNEFDGHGYDGDLSRVEYWCRHIESWVDDGVSCLSFEDLIGCYSTEVGRLAEFLGASVGQVPLDVRRRAIPGNGVLARQAEKLRTRLAGKYTSVGFRRGVCGDHVNHFAPADHDYFEARAGETMRRLGYLGRAG